MITPAVTIVSGDAPLLVGRDRERAMLQRRLTAALAGDGGLVLIGGEAGIGKTALAETLAREAIEQGACVLVGRCYDLNETPPYGPWVDLVAPYRASDDLPPPPDAFTRNGGMSTAASQAALFAQVRHFVITLTLRQPLVLLLDDLHWADPASLDLLRFLARSLQGVPLLIVATYRADDLTDRHPLYQRLPALVRESAVTRLDLRRLRDDDVRVLVRARYALPETDTVRLTTTLQARAEGNPFFLGELLRALEEEDVLRSVGAGWTLGTIAEIGVPPLLQQVIDGRLARLGDDARRLLANAAVIGQEIPFTLWRAVAEGEDERLLAITARASEIRLVAEVPDGTGIRFVHALVREALYEGISPARRRRIHCRVGEVLTSLPNADPDAVAHHFQRAADSRAANWLVKAGERAQLASAREMAAQRYEAALTWLERDETAMAARGWLLYRVGYLRRHHAPVQGIECCNAAARIAEAIDDRALAAASMFMRALCDLYAHWSEKAIADLSAGADALEALSPADLARLDLGPDATGTPAVTTFRGIVVLALATAGYFAQALAMGERYREGLAPATPLGEIGRSSYGDRIFGLAMAYAALGHPAEARDAFQECRATRNRTGLHMNGLLAFDELCMVTLPYYTEQKAARFQLAAEMERGLASNSTGDFFRFARTAYLPVLILDGEWEAARAIERSHLEGMPLVIKMYAIEALAPLARAQGKAAEAWSLVEELLPEGPDTIPGGRQCTCAMGVQRVAVMLALDASDFPLARQWLEAHDRWQQWSGAILGRADGQLCWATYHRAVGNADHAYADALQALTHAAEPHQPLALLATHRLLGELETDARRFDAARLHLDASLALADACAAPYERALTLLALATLRAAGKSNEARKLLDEVRAICVPLGAAPSLARVDLLASRLTVPPIDGANPDRLTPREVDVLRLLANGQTNREMAEALFLSPRTVERYITSLYRKIDARGRADATAYALSGGFVVPPARRS